MCKPRQEISFLSLESLITFYSSHLILIFTSPILNKNVNKLLVRQHKSIIDHNPPKLFNVEKIKFKITLTVSSNYTVEV